MVLIISVLVNVYFCRREEFCKTQTCEDRGVTTATESPGTVSPLTNDNHMGLDMKDVKSDEYASLQSQNPTPAADGKDGKDRKLRNDVDSYAALNAAEVQQSEYTSLNRNPASAETKEDDDSYAYAYMNPETDVTDYEVTITPRMSATYVNAKVADQRN